jgi:hypothetical protein
MGTRSYEDIMRGEKKDVIIQGSIRKLETLHKQDMEKIKKLENTIQELEQKQKEEQDKNERRFSELYSYMNKLENAYYNGLRLPTMASMQPDKNIPLRSLVGNIEQKNSMEELYGKKII